MSSKSLICEGLRLDAVMVCAELVEEVGHRQTLTLTPSACQLSPNECIGMFKIKLFCYKY